MDSRSNTTVSSIPAPAEHSSLVSFVVPAFNEASTLAPLCAQILAVSAGLDHKDAEILLVDDGSTDGSWAVILELCQTHPNVIHGIRLRRNCGKSEALSIGLKRARGHIIVTMDADLQDDPAMIPRFLARLDEGFDYVSGWKQNRNDPLTKTIPSKIFNRITSLATGLKLHDMNCGFKAFRAGVLQHVNLYGDLHRFVPVLVNDLGFRITEVPVVHHARRHGHSKYGWERIPRGFLDLLTVLAITRFSKRPAHLIGGLGLGVSALGMLGLGYLSVLWFLGHRPIGTRPLFLLSVMAVLAGIQLLVGGVLAELFVSTAGAKANDGIIAEETD